MSLVFREILRKSAKVDAKNYEFGHKKNSNVKFAKSTVFSSTHIFPEEFDEMLPFFEFGAKHGRTETIWGGVCRADPNEKWSLLGKIWAYRNYLGGCM